MTLDEANALTDEVTDFLLSCGGIYGQLTGTLQEEVLFCLATGQYLLERSIDGAICHFLCYWKVAPADVELIQDGVMPQERVSGSVLYIVEHGNKTGLRGLRDSIKALRRKCTGMSGLVFNKKGTGIKFYPSQKGD